MSRRYLAAGLAFFLLIATLGWLALPRSGGGTSLSAASEGLLAARLYLERRGVEVRLLDRPLEDYRPGLSSSVTVPGGRPWAAESETAEQAPPALEGTLVLGMPWPGNATTGDLAAIENHLRGGGTVLFLYGGIAAAPVAEDQVARALDLHFVHIDDFQTLSPLAWWRHHKELWDLDDVADLGLATAPRVPPLQVAPRMPGRSRPLLSRGSPVEALGGTRPEADISDGEASGEEGSRHILAFETKVRRGRVVAVPVTLLNNGMLRQGGNVEVLEALVEHLPSPWSFHEFPHGLVAPALPRDDAPRRALDRLLLQLVLVYGLAVAGLARRFGPAWRETRPVSGSTSTFLLGLGALHHRLGHHAEAGALLIDRARQLDPRLRLPEDLVERSRRADAGSLPRLAAEVADHQRQLASATPTGEPRGAS